ncbi:unnamed protein product, partial [Polarella glacialis]
AFAVEMSVDGGSWWFSTPMQLTYRNAPAITDVSPNIAVYGESLQINITGHITFAGEIIPLASPPLHPLPHTLRTIFSGSPSSQARDLTVLGPGFFTQPSSTGEGLAQVVTIADNTIKVLTDLEAPLSQNASVTAIAVSEHLLLVAAGDDFSSQALLFRSDGQLLSRLPPAPGRITNAVLCHGRQLGLWAAVSVDDEVLIYRLLPSGNLSNASAALFSAELVANVRGNSSIAELRTAPWHDSLGAL